MRREKNMEQSNKTDNASKNKNFRDKICERKFLKATTTKKETNSDEEDDSKSVLSDLTFTVTADPDKFQAHSTLDNAGTEITEDSIIKGIFDAASALMQVQAADAHSATDTITMEISNSWVSMLDKKGATIVYQRGNSYFMNAMKF